VKEETGSREDKGVKTLTIPRIQTSHSRHPSPLLFFVRLGTGTGTGRAALGLALARLPPPLPLVRLMEVRPRPRPEPLVREEEPFWRYDAPPEHE
jgi:hypothetical protein